MPQGLWPDLAEWEGPTPNQGPAMSQQRGMVVHIAAGYYKGTIAWQKKPGSASSHFVVAGPRDKPYGVADGKTAQTIDCDVAAWTQQAGNGKWVSVENSGFLPDRLSPAQIESNAQLFARGHLEYGWKLQLAGNPNGFGLGYHSMGSNEGRCNWSGANWGHCECPGANIINQLPLILARAIEIVTGDMADPAITDILNILTGMANGVDEVTVHDKDGKLSLKPFWARIAKETAAAVAANGGGGGGGINFPLQITWTGTSTGTGLATPSE